MNRRVTPTDGAPVDVWQPGRTHPTVVVLCEGPGPVLLDDEPAPGSGAPLTLAPGDSVQWQQDRALTVAVPDGAAPSSVIVSENPGQPTPATAIARAILAQGLAVDIASAISLAGVPAIDRPAVLLAPWAATIPAGITWLSGALDVAEYATVIVTAAVSGVDTTDPEQTQLELRWLTADGTAISTDRVTVWLAPGGGGQTWSLQAPAWGAWLQLALTAPSGVTTSAVNLTTSVVGSYRERAAARSVVTAGGKWGGSVTSTSRPRMSQAVRVFSRAAIPSGETWRDAISPGWPGSRLTLNVQTNIALTGELAFNLLGINELQQVDAVASWTLGSGQRRWTWTVDTPPDTALGFSLPNTGGPASGTWEVEAVWAATPIGLPGAVDL